VKGVNSWWLGFLLIIAFVLLSEMIVIFNEYFYHRLGLNRNLVLTLLWLLPVLASFLAVYFSEKGHFVTGLSYIPVLGFLGPTVHLLVSKLGVAVDFGGLTGLKVTLQVYFFLSTSTMVAGAVMGLLLRKRLSHSGPKQISTGGLRKSSGTKDQ